MSGYLFSGVGVRTFVLFQVKKNHPDIKTAAAYNNAYAEGKFDSKFAKYPPREYVKVWTSWTDFLESKNRRGTYFDIDQARALMVELNLTSNNDFKRYIEDNELPEGCPRAPQMVYREVFKEKGGWKWYLGAAFMSYEEAVRYIRSLRPIISSFNEFRDWAKSDKRPHNFPSQPHSFTGYKGLFVNYPVFLGTISEKGSDKLETNRKDAMFVIKDLLESCPEIKDDVMALCK